MALWRDGMEREAWILEIYNGTTGRIAHVAEPWFVCSFATSPETAGEFYGLTVEMEDIFFHGFTWEKGIPHEETLRLLCAEARQVIDSGCSGPNRIQ